MNSISTPSVDLIKYHPRWRKNRDFLEGKDAVMRAGVKYLPKPTYDLPDDEYRRFLENMTFFPASIRVMSGYLGIVFKKEPDLIAPDTIKAISGTITHDGDSLQTLAWDILRETLITNWTGVLVDYPEAPEGVSLNASNAVVEGYRPFVSVFPAESILDVQYGVIKNLRVISYARVKQDNKTIYELSIDDRGFYQHTTHKLVDGNWVNTKTVYPMKDGQPLTTIPFKIISLSNKKYPQPATFDSIVDMNAEIWTLTGQQMEGVRWTIHPIISVSSTSGSSAEGDSLMANLEYGPGRIWNLTNAEVDIHEFKGENITVINDLISAKQSELARAGSRLLADDKAVAEAAETIAIRNESDNATLAGIVRSVSAQIQNVLDIVAWWIGESGTPVKFTMNTDYTPSQFDKDLITLSIQLHQNNLITDEELFHVLKRPGGPIDEVVSYQDHMSKLEQQIADRPSTTDTGLAL